MINAARAHQTPPFTPIEWLLFAALSATVLVDTFCGIALVVALEWMLSLAGLPDGEVARLILPALGVTLVTVAAWAALTLRWCVARHPHGYQSALLLGAMLVGVGLAQWWSAGGLVGPALDSTRGLVTASCAALAWRAATRHSEYFTPQLDARGNQ